MSSSLPPAALVGVAVDVSGSMQSSIRNRDGTRQSRFQSFQEGLGRVILASRKRTADMAGDRDAGRAEALVFAYAFGLSTSPEVVDLLALVTSAAEVASPGEIERMKQRYIGEIQRRYSGYGEMASLARSFGFGGLVDQFASSARASAEDEVRRRITKEMMTRLWKRLSEKGPVTLTLTDLARLWSDAPASFEQAEHVIFGGTPMRQCLEQVADRFAAEASALPADVQKFLILVSDGEPTDGDPRPALERIRSQGVFVASCLVTDADVTEPRRLYSTPCAGWDAAARLMFEAASAVEDDEVYRELLEGQGWSVDRNSRLFTQINHSEMMDEFLTLTVGRTQGARLGG